MPIRITCPSCSATLSVKDEFAGRAVKCPKCGGVIPPQPSPPTASEPAAVAALPPPPPPPPPEPEKLPLDEPEKPVSTGVKISGKPVARSKDAADRDDEDDRPRRKRRDDEDDRDEDRPRARNRRDDDDDDDRPRRKRRDEDDEDDRPVRRRKPPGKSNAPLILGIVGFFLLTCCGGVGYGVYWTYNKAKETVEAVKGELDKMNLSVTADRYDKVKIGDTRAQADGLLGKGRTATTDDLAKVFRAANDKKKIAEWTPKVKEGRVVIWQNGEEAHVLAAFHPNAEAGGRVQAKEWRAKSGDAAGTGELDDAEFLKRYPPGKAPKGSGKELTPETRVPAEDLAREFQTDRNAAAEKYTNKTFTVNGKLRDLEVVGGETRVILEGAAGDGPHVACPVNKIQNLLPFNFSRGQQLRIEGRCVGATLSTVSFTNCTIRGSDPDPTPQVTAAALISAYRTDTSGDAVYKGKLVRVGTAEVEKLTDGTVVVVPFGRIPGKALTKKIRVEYDPSYTPLYPKLRVGALVTIYGRCEGVSGGEIVITDAWFASPIP